MRNLLSISLLFLAASACAQHKAPFSTDEFQNLHKIIQPQPGEARWATIPWLTNLEAARGRAAAEDKPLFLWRAGGGEVLGRA